MTEQSLVIGPDRDGRAVLVEHGRIEQAGEVQAPAEAARLACGDALVECGRVNAHTHVYSGLAPLGMPPPQPQPQNFLQILERVWWRMDRAHDPDSLRAAARLYVAEALLAGTTTLIDHHESPRFVAGSLDVLADACRELGMRALLCYGTTERNGGLAEAERGLAECARFLGGGGDGPVRGAVGLHASFTVSDATVREAGELCRALDAVLHVHLAEDHADVADAERRGYGGPLERLLELHALPPGSILAHGVHLNEQQVGWAQERGCWLVQNPRSNLANRVGYPGALAVSHKVALGTDGFPARMDEEVACLNAQAAHHADLAERARARLDAGRALCAERFGAAATGLTAGALGDLVVATPERVRHVVVDGRVAVRDGALTGADLDEIRADARTQAAALWRRMEEI